MPIGMAVGLTLTLFAQGSLIDFGVDVNPSETFTTRVITTSRLLDPWEIRWGPDGAIWMTERGAKSVSRLNVATGVRSTLVTIDDSLLRDTQDGVLGLALHPALLTNRRQDFVYVSYVYDGGGPGPGRVRKLRLRRYTYDASTETLGRPLDLLTEIPSFGDHSAGRLLMGQDQKLYLTVGDLAANDMGNQCAANRAQDLPTAEELTAKSWAAYQGKVLRINLDGSIPADNPSIGGVRSHIFTYGHRNPQGLAVGPNGTVYEAEHGPSTDDEVNLLRAGKNYGWPFVAGFQDDKSYVYGNYSKSSPQPCASLAFNPLNPPPSVPRQKETEWSHPDFAPPVRTFFTVGDDYRFSERGNAVIAASGIDVYTSTAIPGWANSVLVASLHGSLFRVKLSADGTTGSGQSIRYFKSKNRYRDVAISPDGRTIFVSVDNWASEDNPGAIMAFTYQDSK